MILRLAVLSDLQNLIFLNTGSRRENLLSAAPKLRQHDEDARACEMDRAAGPSFRTEAQEHAHDTTDGT